VIDDKGTVTPNKRLVEDMLSCARCCKHCRKETETDRLMQIEPAEAPLQPALLLHHPNNVTQRKP
jgi:hypothetical protein